jgi:hypothetical protein
LKNGEGFYTDVVLPFGIKILNMIELRRREDDLPSPSRLKILNACWKENIKNLSNIVQACSEAILKREELFKSLTEIIDLARNTNEVQDPKLILSLMFLTNKQVDIFKGLLAGKFYIILEYNEEEIDNWLVDYSIKNQVIEEEIHGISLELRYFEGELLNIKTRHEINVAPMKNYIKYWFKRAIDKLTKEWKETIEMVPITSNEENKRTTTRK